MNNSGTHYCDIAGRLTEVHSLTGKAIVYLVSGTPEKTIVEKFLLATYFDQPELIIET